MSAFPTNEYRRDAQPARKLFSCLIPTTAKVIYTCPPGKSVEVKAVCFVNIHTGSESVTLHHLLPNDTATNCNTLYYQLALSSKTTVVDDTPKYMTAGDTLVALASATDRIAITVYGIEL
jgi:hypothetical protein